MSDLISRQAALEKVRAMQTYKLFVGDDMILVDKAEVQTELMMLPSAQPEPKWIPVSERLPEERAIVNVTFADGTVGTARFYWKGCPILFGCIMAESSPTAGDIVAWQPLPEPYKAESKTEQALAYADQDTLMPAT